MEDNQNTQTQGEQTPATEQTTANIEVHNNGNGTLTAEVKKASVNPLDTEGEAENSNPEGVENKDKGTQEDGDPDGKLQSDFTNQMEADKNISKELSAKGIDFDALGKEFEEHGELSKESLEKLEKAGYPKSVVDAYISGMQSISDRFVSRVQEFAGGKDGYQQVVNFVSQQPKEYIDAYNRTLASGSLPQIKMMIDGVRSNMVQTHGTFNKTIMGNSVGGSQPEGYTSTSQMVKDMSDPRYQKDAAFTKQVYAKIKNSKFF